MKNIFFDQRIRVFPNGNTSSDLYEMVGESVFLKSEGEMRCLNQPLYPWRYPYEVPAGVLEDRPEIWVEVPCIHIARRDHPSCLGNLYLSHTRVSDGERCSQSVILWMGGYNFLQIRLHSPYPYNIHEEVRYSHTMTIIEYEYGYAVILRHRSPVERESALLLEKIQTTMHHTQDTYHV